MPLRRALPAAVLLVYAVVLVVTLRPDESWGGGDFALYLMHAANIVDGRAYAATAFVPEPGNAIISPAAYPPGFPALLALTRAAGGPSLVAAKLAVTACLLGLVTLTWCLARSRLPPRAAMLTAAAVAVLPGLVERRDRILSDIPFAAASLLALVCAERLRAGRAVGWALALAVAVLVACATRTAGIALVLALLAGCAWTAVRDPSQRVAAGLGGMATVVGTVTSVAVGRLLHVDGATYVSYFSTLAPSDVLPWLLDGARLTLTAIGELFGWSFGASLNAVPLGLLLFAAMSGAWRLLAEYGRGPGMAALALFVPATLALLLLFPVRSEMTRYALPLAAPLTILAVHGAVRFGRLGAAGAASVILLAALPYYAVHDATAPYRPSVTDADSRDLVSTLLQTTAEAGLVVAPNPRIVAWLTGRCVTTWPGAIDAGGFEAWRLAVGADAVVEDSSSSVPGAAVVRAATADWREVGRAGRFRVLGPMSATTTPARCITASPAVP